MDSLSVSADGQKLDIQATVSDPTGDGDQLKEVYVEVVRSTNGKVKYTNTITVSGDSDSIGDATDPLKKNKEYHVTVTVYDGDDDTGSETETGETDGPGGGPGGS